MTVIKVYDMHCENCVRRIHNALNAAGIKFSVSVDNKTVTVDGDEDRVKLALEELEELGFKAERL